MRFAPIPQMSKALIVPALALSLLAIAAPPSDVHRQHATKPMQVTTLAGEQADAPPVAGRQDGPLPPAIFP